MNQLESLESKLNLEKNFISQAIEEVRQIKSSILDSQPNDPLLARKFRTKFRINLQVEELVQFQDNVINGIQQREEICNVDQISTTSAEDTNEPTSLLNDKECFCNEIKYSEENDETIPQVDIKETPNGIILRVVSPNASTSTVMIQNNEKLIIQLPFVKNPLIYKLTNPSHPQQQVWRTTPKDFTTNELKLFLPNQITQTKQHWNINHPINRRHRSGWL